MNWQANIEFFVIFALVLAAGRLLFGISRKPPTRLH